MTTWTVCSIMVSGYIHSAAMNEIVEAILCGLIDLGHDARLVHSVSPSNCILVGGHLLSQQECEKVPQGTIVYNSEHVNSVFFAPNHSHYADMLRRTTTWDYNSDNARELSVLLKKHIMYVPLGYVPQFTRIEPSSEDIDVLFYGWVNHRRQAVLDDLSNRGLHVHCGTAVYGADRDRLIARAKVILNIHYHLPGALEIVRVGYLLANRKAVVSESNIGETIDDDLIGAYLGVPYDELAGATYDLVNDPMKRHLLEQQAFKKFSERPETDILRTRIGIL